MALDRIVVLVGGVGGAKLALGLTRILPPDKLTIIVNTGDDFWLYGLRICPDLDTIMYTLSGLVDKTNGWGVAGDTLNTLHAMARYGEESWFRLGDQDLATHVLRTKGLREGKTLTAVTRQLTTALGIQHSVLPMTDDEVATKVDTIEYGELDFQVYFVRHRWQPTVISLRIAGADRARMTTPVQEALASADAILFAPSNPWLSIDPILAVPGLRAAILARAVPRVAVTPIIRGSAVKGPAAKLMAELGYMASAENVAHYYGEVLNGFIGDERDGELAIPQLKTRALNTLMQTDEDKVTLARNVLEWIKGWN